jgi:hypothetical protein
MKIKQGLVLGAVFGFAAANIVFAETTTALSLVKKGDQYVGMQSKDKILRIYSDKSAGTLEPNIWHVVYYDPDATFKSQEVKFGAGQEMEASHPMSFAMPAKSGDVMDQSKVTIDSDKALQIAQEQPLLKGLTLKSSKMTLSKTDNGPTWKVELWAAKTSDPTKTAGIGNVQISAADGSVIKTDLHPDSAD